MTAMSHHWLATTRSTAVLAGGLAFAGAWGTAFDVDAQQPVTRPEIAPGTGGREQALQGIGVDERFDARVPMEATFRDHEGHVVRLGDIVDGTRPVVLHFVYYSCATVCDLAMNNVATTLTQQQWTVGTDFDVITISMDPRDTVSDAAAARGRLLGRYGRTEAEHGWHFLVGDEDEIARLADAVGYRFRWDEPSQQYLHPAVLIVLQDSGAVARYLYGLEIPSADLRLGLLEASQNRWMTTTERVLTFCFRYDQHDGRYVLVAWNVMRLGGALTVALLGGFLGTYWLRERRRARKIASGSSTAPSESRG
jgi:protein SCO1/2